VPVPSQLRLDVISHVLSLEDPGVPLAEEVGLEAEELLHRPSPLLYVRPPFVAEGAVDVLAEEGPPIFKVQIDCNASGGVARDGNETFMAHRATHADENRNILILHESDTTSS